MRFNKHIIIFFILTFLLGFENSFAQWANDPSSNTKLVTDPVDPINILSVRDYEGGTFIFWQDKKNNSSSDVYFTHIDQNGNPSLRTDGKSVTSESRLKENPYAVAGPGGNAIVVWQESDKKSSNLFIQKISKNGLRLWGADGLLLTDSGAVQIDYSLQADKNGFSFVSFVKRTSQILNEYSVEYRKIDPHGRIVEDSTQGLIYNTNNIISETEIVSDDKGGSFLFWLESIKQKTILRAEYIDSTGSRKWGSEPLTVSKQNSSVISYSVGKMGSGVYAAITYQGAKKIVLQQLVSEDGKLLWGTEGKVLTSQKGSQNNPQFFVVDSLVVVSWTNQLEKVKDVFIQRFDNKGNPLWKANGTRIINIKGNQFGQKLIYDDNGGIIVAWIDKPANSSYADLSIQKIDLSGNLMWDKDGVKISSSKNMKKSYLNLVPDDEGGAIAIFKGSAGKKNDIYGQKIFSTGTYASQILGFSTEIINDSVKVYWYAANETVGTSYQIQRAFEISGADSGWQTIANLQIENKKNASYYEYYDVPGVSGSIYYRIVQQIENKVLQTTVPGKVDYFYNVESIVLAQNSPNPFSDSTVITFYLPEEDEVTLEIFDSFIQTVEKVEDKDYPAGKNTYVFKANGLEPGVYYYRLKATGFIDVKKMVITN